ncbi:hypothetical protein [Paludisphaera mucosa]|uniref:Uncharacterized protein n=1 Tax=Paludisphaera mucosa TaxID=3030827 RepID=A0ABT6FLH0_9BACT|nr:hypothetical protein [Paludisphaera mucosa]MDG3008427.1 hypothetical protein [Paludisphaera mucosa]
MIPSESKQESPSAEAEPLLARRRWGRLDIQAFAVDDVGERVRMRRRRKWWPKDRA